MAETGKRVYCIMAIHTDLQIPTSNPFASDVQRKDVKQEVLKTGSEHDQPSLSKHENEMHTTKTNLKRKATENPNDRLSELVYKIEEQKKQITCICVGKFEAVD